MLKIIIKNIDKKNFLVYGISIALFSAIIFIISSLFYINDNVNLGGDSESVKMVFVLYYMIIIISGFMFVIYALKFYIKSRVKEYSLFIILGTPRKNVLAYLLVEFMIVFCFATLLGIILGMIVIILISVVFYFNEIKIVPSFEMLMENIRLTLFVSFIIFVFGCVNSIFHSSKKDLSKMMTINVKKEYRYNIACFFSIFGIIILINAIRILNGATFGEIMLSLCASLFAIYLLLTFGLSFIVNIYIKYFKKSYYRNILNINDFVYRYKTNKTLMFITFILNTVIIFFSGGMIITTYQVTDIHDSNMLVLRISSYFMALFTVFCNMGILFLKQLNDSQLKMNNYEILKYLGMSEKDRKNNIVADFKLLLIGPILISDILVWFYIIAECKRVGLFNLTYVLSFIIFQILLIFIQVCYYHISKKYLIRKMIY